MTDNEIIKFMQCVIGNDANCSECAYQKTLPFPSCRRTCAKDALDLINRQKAEIEGLEETRYELACIIDELLMCMADGKETKSAKPIDINEIKSGAIKEFADRLKEECLVDRGYEILHEGTIDNLVKEMTEVKDNA